MVPAVLKDCCIFSFLPEDNPASRKVVEKILRKAGHKFSSVENGRMAWEFYKEQFFPIVPTDRIMPELGNLELCRAAHADQISPEAIIKKGDDYLYQAKKDGRSRVIAG